MLCSLRPEKIRLSTTGGRLVGTVLSRIFLGNHWLFQVATGVGELLIYRQNAGEAVPEEGVTVGLDWDDAALLVLAEEG